jgi:RNA polymerase sigma-70 factor (sigma-E family)
LRALDARGPAVAPPQPGAPSAEPRNLADLYRDHRMRMVRLAVLLVDDPSTAEDVVQEAFTGLHRHWAGLRDEAAAVAYLRTAVVNGSRSVLRRRRTARDYVPPHQVNARSAESLAMLSAEHQAVVDALGTLPPRQREVLVLRYYGGMSEAEIAEATGISRGTVKSTASRALDAVQRAMAGRPGRG